MDTPIYARTSGYLKRWYFDIGAHVRKGQLMAEIETPELDQQLQVAEADLKSAEANLDLANTTADPLSQPAQDQLRLQAGDRPGHRRRRSQKGRRRRRHGKCSPPAAVAVLREGLCPLRRHRHRPQHRCRSADRRRFRLRAQRALPSCGHRQAPRLCSCARGLCRRHQEWRQGHASHSANPRPAFRRNHRAQLQHDRSCIAHPQRRSRRGQPQRQLLLPGSYVFVHFKVPRAHREPHHPVEHPPLPHAKACASASSAMDESHLVPITITHDAGEIVEVASGQSQPTDEVILDPSDSLTEGQQVHVSRQKQAGDAMNRCCHRRLQLRRASPLRLHGRAEVREADSRRSRPRTKRRLPIPLPTRKTPTGIPPSPPIPPCAETGGRSSATLSSTSLSPRSPPKTRTSRPRKPASARPAR